MAKMQFIGTVAGMLTPEDSRYLVSYDPNYHLPDGSYDGGLLETTTDPAQALDTTVSALLAIWKLSPTCACHCTREDGQPNQPLTAWTVALEQ